jgi:hypothetical protein
MENVARTKEGNRQRIEANWRLLARNLLGFRDRQAAIQGYTQKVRAAAGPDNSSIEPMQSEIHDFDNGENRTKLEHSLQMSELEAQCNTLQKEMVTHPDFLTKLRWSKTKA